jgi:hypothetical protein
MELVTDPWAGTQQERRHRVRVEAQLRVRSLKHEAAEYDRLLRETQILLDNTVDRLKAAESRLAELGGELPLAAHPQDLRLRRAQHAHGPPRGRSVSYIRHACR